MNRLFRPFRNFVAENLSLQVFTLSVVQDGSMGFDTALVLAITSDLYCVHAIRFAPRNSIPTTP